MVRDELRGTENKRNRVGVIGRKVGGMQATRHKREEEVAKLALRTPQKNNWKHTARTTTSTPPSIFDNPIKFATQVAKLVVSSVVVLYRSQPTGNRQNVTFRCHRYHSNGAGTSGRKRDNPASAIFPSPPIHIIHI
jgi:hypothetical protein